MQSDPFSRLADGDAREALQRMVQMNLALGRGAIGYWQDWLEIVTGFVEAAGSTLSECTSDPSRSQEAVARMLDAYQEYVRRTTELPQNILNDMQEQIRKMNEERVPDREPGSSSGEPKRRARAKD